MNAIVWVDAVDCHSLHEESLAMFGGLPGVRDQGLLESALNRPRQLLAYGQPDLFELAAAYAFGIARNHPFLDGNKRAAFLCAALFLEVNGCKFSAPETDVVLQTLALAAGELDEAGYGDWLRASCGVKPKAVAKPYRRSRSSASRRTKR